MVCRPELLLAPECCNKMSCDDIGLRPVLRGFLCRVWEVQNRLIHWQAGDPMTRDSFLYAPEGVRQERIPEFLLD